MTLAPQEIVQAPVREWKSYPEYKDTGVEWLGEIPGHWSLKALRYLFLTVGGSTPSSGVPAYWEGDIPWVTPEDLGRLTSNSITSTRRQITQVGYESSGTTMLPVNSLIMSTRAPIGHLAIAGTKLCTNQGCKALVFRGTDEKHFFYYQLLAAREEIKSWGQGSTFQELGRNKLEAIRLVQPPLPEQQAIAAFLDRETQKIDDLITKREPLIELLEEKRTALISRAVTKGLDPDVPMKESGVEWLGEIPEYWEALQLKYALAVEAGAVKTGPFGSQLVASEMTDDDIKVYNQRNVIERNPGRGENYISKKKFRELYTFRVTEGDLLLTTRGTIGRCMILPEDAEEGILHPCLMRIRTDDRVLITEFLMLMIQESSLILPQLFALSHATTIEVIYSDNMKRVLIPVPPIDEQRQIVDFLRLQTAKINSLIGKMQNHIEKLREYRTALISAAVTGKIDVREELS